ncbi:uncharacterized protein CTRU02_215136 [Colletotrichum truncatum]|uniref:Uncharacterized protein n=1 Tax=Colletotrichum truncatum TaxID=5467 RepID=A0ACC3YDM5_COLTU
MGDDNHNLREALASLGQACHERREGLRQKLTDLEDRFESSFDTLDLRRRIPRSALPILIASYDDVFDRAVQNIGTRKRSKLTKACDNWQISPQTALFHLHLTPSSTQGRPFYDALEKLSDLLPDWNDALRQLCEAATCRRRDDTRPSYLKRQTTQKGIVTCDITSCIAALPATAAAATESTDSVESGEPFESPQSIESNPSDSFVPIDEEQDETTDVARRHAVPRKTNELDQTPPRSLSSFLDHFSSPPSVKPDAELFNPSALVDSDDDIELTLCQIPHPPDDAAQQAEHSYSDHDGYCPNIEDSLIKDRREQHGEQDHRDREPSYLPQQHHHPWERSDDEQRQDTNDRYTIARSITRNHPHQSPTFVQNKDKENEVDTLRLHKVTSSDAQFPVVLPTDLDAEMTKRPHSPASPSTTDVIDLDSNVQVRKKSRPFRSTMPEEDVNPAALLQADTWVRGEWLNAALGDLLQCFCDVSFIDSAEIGSMGSRQTYKAKSNVFECLSNNRLVLLPLFVDGNHWVSACIEFEGAPMSGIKSMKVLNSLPTYTSDIAAEELVASLVKQYKLDQGNAKLARMACARQENTSDCGIMVLVNLLTLTLGYMIPASVNTAVWRRVMAILLVQDPSAISSSAGDILPKDYMGKVNVSDGPVPSDYEEAVKCWTKMGSVLRKESRRRLWVLNNTADDLDRTLVIFDRIHAMAQQRSIRIMQDASDIRVEKDPKPA